MTAVGEYFEHTATGVLGEKRDTMLHNQLHLRNKLGRPMERGYINYPGEQYRYGVPNATRDGGASEALSGWPNRGGLYFHRKDTIGDEPLERDFISLNKSAVLNGITNSQDQTQFRATNDVRKKVQDTKSEQRVKTPRKIPVNMVYGVATRPATPIDQLIQHRYQDKWLEETRSADLAQRAKSEMQRRRIQALSRLKPGKVCNTRTSLMRVYQVPVEDAPLWHLPKFAKKAQPHLKTFATDRARDLAFLAHSSDGIARRGVCGQGIYEPAKM
ncbi:hypothetical protein CAPTEDRAFT_21391 [Capitella teleta]|uniref:Cilia- and flagella-associated protein 77 n=1 Tax=Capitella teleta TaxID=283909 RepID=R7T8V9_CAPTE|nr:hypothetical protein CAPTEDRAFT_21391 [Capitella teleta]|eukprot:ELT89858.1 hypothetical protein CAPTEDRAFT_21391 [Capitella teleta]